MIPRHVTIPRGHKRCCHQSIYSSSILSFYFFKGIHVEPPVDPYFMLQFYFCLLLLHSSFLPVIAHPNMSPGSKVWCSLPFQAKPAELQVKWIKSSLQFVGKQNDGMCLCSFLQVTLKKQLFTRNISPVKDQLASGLLDKILTTSR